MLEDLDVQDGNRVLEIGTGIGYNAALLCARLGDSLVHSVDVGRFMPARTDALAYPGPRRTERAPAAGSRTTTLTARAFRGTHPLRLVLAFQLPGTELVHHVGEDGTALQFQREDGSWARVPLAGDTRTLTYGGDGELWTAAEAAWEWWQAAGRPEHDAFGYVREPTATYAWYRPDGTLWYLEG
ncbi:hypothetical protein [Streptomyces sp. NPDC088789]|uniref:hypothetical protein n=1 Tax=Streptomyces sp. NPDC088789 TaxID=3365899 RepID=UPI00381CD584